MKILLLFSLIICFIISINSVKVFIPNTNFVNKKNWKENRLPCPGNHLLFPKKIPRVLFSGSELPYMADMDLPINGEILLDNSVMITSAYMEPEVHECDSAVSHFGKVQPDYWYNPYNWCEKETLASPCIHKPQVEASIVPSANDFVIFLPKNSFYVGFHPSEPRILAKLISFRNHIYTNSQLFRKRIQRTFSRKYPEFVNINSTYPPDFDLQGNMCKRNLCISNSNLEIGRMKSICQYVICQPLSCRQQVKPKGSCCRLCGHILMVKLISKSQKSLFEKWLNNLLNNYYQNKIIFDLLSTDSDQFQITLSSITNELHLTGIAEEIKNKILKQRNTNGAKYVDCISCKQTNPSSVQIGSKIGIIILIFIILIVFLVSLLILIKHKRPEMISNIQTRLPTIPKLHIPPLTFNFFSNNFPRFRLKEPYDDSLGLSSSGVENIELPNTGVEVFFDNPIYVPDINDTNH